MSKSGGGQRSSTASQSGVDPTTMAYVQQIMAAAQAAGASGPSPLTTGAAGYNSGLQNAGATGTAALSGDPAAAAQLMNPYQGQVIDATNAQWDNQDQKTMNDVNSRATAAGAFGGSRAAVAQGSALAANNLNRNSQISGLLSTGYDNTMARAGTLAGMGAEGANQNANLGLGGVGNAQQWLMQMLNQGFHPTGTTSSTSSAGVGGSGSWNGGDALKALSGLFGGG